MKSHALFRPQPWPVRPRPAAAAISSSVSGFSSDERSPGSLPRAFARTARSTIFALRVFGSAETKSTSSGAHAFRSYDDESRRRSHASSYEDSEKGPQEKTAQ